jgi:hypothetical protein
MKFNGITDILSQVGGFANALIFIFSLFLGKRFLKMRFKRQAAEILAAE